MQLLAALVRLLRFCIGWHAYEGIPTDCIAVYVHTSAWDAFVFWLYSFETPMVAVMKPQLFTPLCGPILRRLGFIPAPRLEDRGTGGVERLAQEILCARARATPLVALISPKGSVQKREWRSGYKHLAATLGWPIRPLLLDYELRRVVLLPPLETENDLKGALGQAAPRHPERSELPIEREYDHAELKSVVDYVVLSNVAMVPATVRAVAQGHYGTAMLGLATTSVSLLYHSSREQKLRFYDVGFAYASFAWFAFFYGRLSSPLTRLALNAAILCYGRAVGRYDGCCLREHRGEDYITWHSAFHCLVGLAAFVSLG